jgi:hypothetical protein
VSLYKSIDSITDRDFITYFPNIRLPVNDGSTIALIGTCWPDW